MKTKSKKKFPFQQRLSPSQREFNRFRAELQSKRSCGTCTACCDAIGVEQIDKPVFTPCKHLCGAGCAIYKSRPGQCREYMCAWKALWTPEDESWRPDHLGVIFDMHMRGVGGRPAIRCWQLRSETQVLDDPRVRKMAYALAAQMNLPVVARYADIMNISVHLISRVDELCVECGEQVPEVPVYLLTPDVISDPQDFDRKRELGSDDETVELVSQFGFMAFRRLFFSNGSGPEIPEKFLGEQSIVKQ